MNKIREARESSELTQLELAEILGVSQQLISFYENGSVTPSVKVLKKMAELFDKRMEELV